MALSNLIKVATKAITVTDKFKELKTIKSSVPSTTNAPQDLRIRISMAPDAPDIFYKDQDNWLLQPLSKTSGFLFPLQPAITLNHSAEYQSVKPTHSNFPYHYYTNSEIQQISLTGEFPIRTTEDARYVNAGIHFLRSCTRMFNSQDSKFNLAGSPPLVVRLQGLGFSGFDNVPVVINSVAVNYVDSVDYITFKPFNNAETAKLPSLVTIQINMTPIFSRDFITNQYNTLDYSSGKSRLLGPSITKTLEKLTIKEDTGYNDLKFIAEQGNQGNYTGDATSYGATPQQSGVSTSGPTSVKDDLNPPSSPNG